MIESDDVDVVLVLTSMNVHGALASAALAAGKHVLVEKPMATSLEEAAALMRAGRGRRPGISSARRTSCSRRPSAPSARTSSAATSGGCCWRARATAGPGPTGARWFYERGGGALFDLGVYNVTALCGLFGPRAARHGDGRRRDPRARRRGRADARAGRGQRARADRLRRRALRVGHDRLHDAEVPLARDRAVRHRRRAAAARRRLGARGLRALAQRRAAPGSCSRRAIRTGSGPRACAISSTASRAAASR